MPSGPLSFQGPYTEARIANVYESGESEVLPFLLYVHSLTQPLALWHLVLVPGQASPSPLNKAAAGQQFHLHLGPPCLKSKGGHALFLYNHKR